MLSAMALAAIVWPLAAQAAGPLLSGYGGPGQGSQAILGSTLIGGGGSGSSGSGGGGEGPSGTAAALAAPSQGPSGQGAGTPGAGSVRHASAPSSARRLAGAPAASPRQRLAEAGAAAQSAYRALERGGSAPGSAPLGLSGADFSYIAVALLVLVATGLLTRQITRGRPLKGQG